MDPMSKEGTNETIPLRPLTTSRSYMPVSEVGRTVGTTYFLFSTLFASIIPIIQLGIGLHYKGQCPIDESIPTYMIVAGICGLALVALSLFLAITFKCFISDSTTLTILASCGICLNVLATFLISIFVFIWFILGCVWVFSIRDRVEFEDQPKSTNYCHPVLYKSTFALLIITIVWACIQCCLSCYRTFYPRRQA
ncbi:unnamed protein product [Rotaria sp. Silwood1]|nr:unnamed protein product [Rotaria sp. Silwood1]CAF1028010.1 unnamed protein product [Rotaria sp. Silwood1]CAF3389479.1 unnamed protein product [Rotaria sp. Silwood1]CAF3423734.1 unnamed protein product [Rotaria sp. Silwood1]CAF3436438.1 unnamed protein product [Rotaria sp. Silwood1]